MRPRDSEVAARIQVAFEEFRGSKHPLPGIETEIRKSVLIEQILESIHRVTYVAAIMKRPIDPKRADPQSEYFDPLKAALLHKAAGRVEEAYWLVFLFVHFGKHAVTKWRLARDIYGRLGSGDAWDWASVRANAAGFRTWLAENEHTLLHDGVARKFGGHRHYESISSSAANSTGLVVESYVNWIAMHGSHAALFNAAIVRAKGDAGIAFDVLYREMKVLRFGRLAKFDYLCMIGKLGLADIRPNSPYMAGATGPAAGAKLLFGGDVGAAMTSKSLNDLVRALDAELKVGMQVLEDALCNWQKAPEKFVRFRG